MQMHIGKVHAIWTNLFNGYTCMPRMTKCITVRELGNFHRIVSYCFKGRDCYAILNKFTKMPDIEKREVIRRINESASQILLPYNLSHLETTFKKIGENMQVKLTNIKQRLEEEIVRREKVEIRYEQTRETNVAQEKALSVVSETLLS